MARTRPPSLYVVHRVAVQASRYDDATLYANASDRERSGVPVGGFATEAAADALCAELERRAREATPVGPFLRGLVPVHTGRITAAAAAAGLPAPDLSEVGRAVGPTQHDGYATYGDAFFRYVERVQEAVAAWWAGVAADVAPGANARLWDDLFPDHRFYTVVRVLVEE